ncbi:MAG TPA: hypothetical protein VIF15_09550 [Polyangiaceae bacterium]|jgi:hypothetical protein
MTTNVPPLSRGSRWQTARRWLLGGVVALAVLVHLPALWAPFMLDDYAQASMAEGKFGPARSPFNLYDYIDDADRPGLFEHGAIPWWTHPRLVVRFFRPLSSALVWLDHQAFGRHAVWQHLHSLLWWAVATLGVHTLLRRSFPRRAAFFGTLAFALAPCHAVPLVWLANREALVSTALGTWALVAYASWREGRRGKDGLASLALFSLAVLAGEYTLCFAGYVLAIELVRRERFGRRLLGLSTFAAPAAAYVVAHVLLHYDAHGSGFYRNPLHDFGAYALGAPRRLAILSGAAWLGTDDSWTASSWWQLSLLGAGTLAILALVVWRVIRGLGDDERRRALWMLLGSVFSLAPVLSVEASARLLGVAMVGASGVVGVVLDRAWFPPSPEPRRGLAELTALVALALAFAHYVRAPFDTLAVMRASSRGARAYAERIGWVHDHVQRGRSTIFVVRANSPETTLWAPSVLGDAAPDRWRVLSVGSGRSLLLRTGPRTLELVASERPLFNVGPDDLFRNLDELMVGDTVDVPGMRATVLQIDERQMPRRLRFELDRDVEDPSLEWIAEGDSGFRQEPPPPVGYGAPIVP